MGVKESLDSDYRNERWAARTKLLLDIGREWGPNIVLGILGLGVVGLYLFLVVVAWINGAGWFSTILVLAPITAFGVFYLHHWSEETLDKAERERERERIHSRTQTGRSNW